MYQINKKRVMFLFFCLFIRSILPAAPASRHEIEANAFLNKSSYLIGEPIYLTLELKTLSENMIEFKTRLAFSYGDIKVTILKPNQLPLDYKGVFEPTLYPHYVIEIFPHYIERITLCILYSEDSEEGVIFNKPGKAAISVSLSGLLGNEQIKFSFRPFPVEIVAPVEKDLEALKSLDDKSIFHSLHMSRANPDNIDKFEAFLKAHPSTAYTPYILYVTASSYMTKIGKRKPDFRKAIKMFESYIDAYPDTTLTDDAVYKIAECHHNLEERETAKRWFIKLHNEYPESNRVNHYDSLLKEYLFPEKKIHAPELWTLYDTSIE